MSAPTEHEVRIVALGDSTTFGYSVENSYPRQLELQLKKRRISATVVNSGVNGDTTDGGWLRFGRDVLEYKPDVVIIQFGLNDQPNRFYTPPRGLTPYVSLQSYENNLERFVDELRARNVLVLLMTPNLMCWTPVLEHHYPAGPYLDPPPGGNGLLQEYVSAVRRVARRNEVPIVDIYSLYEDFERKSGKPIQSVFLDDGVHPNEFGYAMNVEHILPTLLPMLNQRISNNVSGRSNDAASRDCCYNPRNFANEFRVRCKCSRKSYPLQKCAKSRLSDR